MLVFKRIPISAAVISAISVLALSACGGSDNNDAPPVSQAKPAAPEASATFLSPASGIAAACPALKGNQATGGFPANTTIVFSKVVLASATSPEHCEIKGTINGGRIGADGQT